nr:hypothetical protein [Candidatus Parabeggiatoa sp.]
MENSTGYSIDLPSDPTQYTVCNYLRSGYTASFKVSRGNGN